MASLMGSTHLYPTPSKGPGGGGGGGGDIFEYLFVSCVPLVALFWSFSEEDSDENRGKLAAALIQSDI